MPILSPIRTIFPIKCGAGSVNVLAWRMVWSYHSQDNGLNGVEHVCGSWFFVLDTLSPTVVGALSAQITQLNGPFPPSAVFIALPRCWRVCQHRYHFFIFSHSILSTSYSTAGSWPVKEHSSLKFLRVFFTTFGRAFYVFLRIFIFNFLQPWDWDLYLDLCIISALKGRINPSRHFQNKLDHTFHTVAQVFTSN